MKTAEKLHGLIWGDITHVFTNVPMHEAIAKNLSDTIHDRITVTLTEHDAEILKDFFIWCSRKAKVEIIDAEKAIEVDGYANNDFVPIWTLDKLVKQYLKEKL